MIVGDANKAQQDRLEMLGIPRSEMTPAVSLALSALLEKLDDTTREMNRLRETLHELEQLVDVDCLVPIPNRRAFMRRLHWAIAMHERYGHPVSVLFFDLNGLKNINDTYGHSAGDQAIRHTSQLLSTAIRQSDYLARISGDEFAMIFYYADHDQAMERASRIAESFHSRPVIINSRPVPLSTAYGVYTLKAGDTAESALNAADMAMYMHKNRMKHERLDINT